MLLWDHVVEIVRESIFAYAQATNGNLGTGILVVTFLARLALLPVGVRLARAMARQQQAMARLEPAIERLRVLHKGNPRRLADEMNRLFAAEGVSPFSLSGLLGSFAQMPVFLALYSAVRQAAALGGRFLWIRDLAKPDWIVVVIATAFTVAGAAGGTATPGQSRSMLLLVSAAVTFFALSKMAAGVGLYWAMSSLFGAIQSWVVQRSLRVQAA